MKCNKSCKWIVVAVVAAVVAALTTAVVLFLRYRARKELCEDSDFDYEFDTVDDAELDDVVEDDSDIPANTDETEKEE